MRLIQALSSLCILLLSLSCAQTDGVSDEVPAGGDKADSVESSFRALCEESGGQWIRGGLGAHCRCGFAGQFAPDLGGCIANEALETACTDSGGDASGGSCACGSATLNGIGECESGDSAGGDAVAGERIYQDNCTTCHGLTGGGDGLVGASLNPTPTNFSAASFRFDANGDGAVGTGADLVLIIEHGAAYFGGSVLMSPWPSLSDQDRKDVASYILTLAR